MKRTKKYTATAKEQSYGITNINLLKILAFFTEVVKGKKNNDCKIALILLLALLIGIKIAELLGKWLAYNI